MTPLKLIIKSCKLLNLPDFYGDYLLNLNNFINQRNFYVAKCNLGKVNLELMLPAVSPSLHMIRGSAPLEFAGANYVQPCLLATVAINAFVSESLRNH